MVVLGIVMVVPDAPHLVDEPTVDSLVEMGGLEIESPEPQQCGEQEDADLHKKPPSQEDKEVLDAGS